MKLHTVKSLRFLFNLLLMIALGGILMACQDDFDIKDTSDPVLEDGIVFKSTDMINVYTGDGKSSTRASSTKDEDEKEIKTLHIFFFNQWTGELMKTTNYNNFQGYMKKTSGFLKIPTPPAGESLFVDGDTTTVRIVAIANIDATEWTGERDNEFFTAYSPNGKIAEASRDKSSKPLEITKYSDLEKWVYYPRLRVDESTGKEDIRKLPAAGMPMKGELSNVKLNEKPKTPYEVKMEALMAKVYVTVELKPDEYIDNLPEMVIEEVGIRNLPVAVPFKKPTGMRRGATTLTRPDNYNDYIENYDVTNVPMVHPGTEHNDECLPVDHECTVRLETPIVLNRRTGAETIKYYTYENIQLPNFDAIGANGQEMFPDKGMVAEYPDSVNTDARKQRWKSVIAHQQRASALILKGTYTTHQEVNYQAKFTVYMGSNAVNDFQVKRNHRYDNNITIYGLDYMRNSDDEVFNYDGRLDLVSDNPIYLAVVNERKIDAHASVLPVDFWLMMWEDANKKGEGNPNVDWHSVVTVSIDQPESHTWIRMDKVIPRSTMEGSGWKAGTGARDYFTTTLMDELDSNTTMTIDGETDGSRSRIYFYIDENVPTTATVKANTYGDREATIKVNYKRYSKSTGELVQSKDYTLDILQRGLIPVSGQRQGRTDDKENVTDTWMEYYEEYLAHNDPLDGRVMPGEYYSGLQWGPKDKDCRDHWTNEMIYRKNIFGTAYRNYKEKTDYNEVYGCEGAIPTTAWMVNQLGGITDIKLYNEIIPKSAFHYAYGKNKRKTDGTVENTTSSRNSGWYLPGIRELEAAITQFYTDFTDFQGNFYWSAAPAEESSPYDHARATKVKSISGNTATYEESGKNAPHPGWKERSDFCRVRTFYQMPQ